MESASWIERGLNFLGAMQNNVALQQKVRYESENDG